MVCLVSILFNDLKKLVLSIHSRLLDLMNLIVKLLTLEMNKFNICINK